MLHPQAQAFMDRVTRAGAPPLHQVGVEAMRANGPRLRRLGGEVEDLPLIEDIVIPASAPVRARRYSSVASGTGRPTLVFAHGGGWVAGAVDEIDAPLSKLVRRSGWDVISVDYRLAPEHPHPAATEDVQATMAWAAESASVLAVGGESAGGALAVSAAQWWQGLRQSTPVQLLIGIYPALGADLSLPSYATNSTYGLTRDDVAWFFEQYLPEGTDRAGAIPLESDTFAGLPPTYLISAEYDVLIDEAHQFVDRLRADGVDVEHHIEAGMVHGFFGLGAIMDASDTAVDLIAARLRSIVTPEGDMT
jgi:acetyl esterase